jgi:hypothetical protein
MQYFLFWDPLLDKIVRLRARSELRSLDYMLCWSAVIYKKPNTQRLFAVHCHLAKVISVMGI